MCPAPGLLYSVYISRGVPRPVAEGLASPWLCTRGTRSASVSRSRFPPWRRRPPVLGLTGAPACVQGAYGLSSLRDGTPEVTKSNPNDSSGRTSSKYDHALESICHPKYAEEHRGQGCLPPLRQELALRANPSGMTGKSLVADGKTLCGDSTQASGAKGVVHCASRAHSYSSASP